MNSVSDRDIPFELANLDNWPATLDHMAMFDALMAWVTGHVIKHRSDLNDPAIRTWSALPLDGPVPIGRIAIREDSRLREEHRGPLQKLAVLEGDEYLQFASRGVVGRTQCEALFLAKPAGQRNWQPGEVAFRVGGYPADGDIAQVMDSAKRWWASFAGMPIRGRPSGIRPVNEVEQMIDLYLASLDTDAKPLLADFQKMWGYAERTWDRHTKEWGKTWTQLKRDGLERRQSHRFIGGI